MTFGYVCAGLLLYFSGFHAEQGTLSRATMLRMKAFDSMVPTMAMAAAMALLLHYPITARRMGTLRAVLDGRPPGPTLN